MKLPTLCTRLITSDYFVLTRFVVPLILTNVITDIGEQFLNRSLAHTVNVVDTLAAFGLAYVFVKLFLGMLREVKQVGVVLVHDRPGYHKLVTCVLLMGTFVVILLITIAKTQLGVWLIKDLHRVSDRVAELVYNAVVYLSLYPAIDSLAWFHGGILLQHRHSTLVGLASMADIMAQIFCVAILLYTPLACTTPIIIPILATYAGVLTRCVILLIGFFKLVYKKLSKSLVEKVTILKFIVFLAPLVFVLGVQRMSRPLVNLLVSRYSPTECDAAKAIAVLTATYPLGHLTYGWLNELRTVSPTFQKKRVGSSYPVIAGRKIAIFITVLSVISLLVSLAIDWIPGVSVAILVYAVSIPRELALLCVDPLRVFAFYSITVSVRASVTGWLTLHRQTKLVAPSAFIRLGIILAVFFTLRKLQVSGALLGVLALFSGFVAELVVLGITAPLYACWRRWRRRRSVRIQTGADLNSLPGVLANGRDTDSPSRSKRVATDDLEQLVNSSTELRRRTNTATNIFKDGERAAENHRSHEDGEMAKGKDHSSHEGGEDEVDLVNNIQLSTITNRGHSVHNIQSEPLIGTNL